MKNREPTVPAVKEPIRRVQPQPVRSEAEAAVQLSELLRRRPDLASQHDTFEVYRSFYQFNGHPTDLERPSITLSESEIALLNEGNRLRDELHESYLDVASNQFWGFRAISLSEEALASDAVGDQRACLDPAFALQHLFALRLHHAGCGEDAEARQWAWFERVLRQSSELEGASYSMEELLCVNTRDLALFGLHQQLGILDARGTFAMHWAAIAARTLLEHRGTWGYLGLLLAKQAQDASSWTTQEGDVVMVQASDQLRPLLDA